MKVRWYKCGVIQARKQEGLEPTGTGTIHNLTPVILDDYPHYIVASDEGFFITVSIDCIEIVDKDIGITRAMLEERIKELEEDNQELANTASNLDKALRALKSKQPNKKPTPL